MRARCPLAIFTDERDFFFQCLERGLTQKNRTFAGWRAFNNGFRVNAAFWHLILNGIDIEGARGQVVDVWAFERHDVSNQAMCIVEAMIQIGADIGMVVPTESFENFRNQCLGVCITQTALRLCLLDESDSARREDIAFGKDLFRFFTQLFI